MKLQLFDLSLSKQSESLNTGINVGSPVPLDPCGSKRRSDKPDLRFLARKPASSPRTTVQVAFGTLSATSAVRPSRAPPKMQGNRASRCSRSGDIAPFDSHRSRDRGPWSCHYAKPTRPPESPLPELSYRVWMEGDSRGPGIRSWQNRLSTPRSALERQLHTVPHEAGVCKHGYRMRRLSRRRTPAANGIQLCAMPQRDWLAGYAAGGGKSREPFSSHTETMVDERKSPVSDCNTTMSR